MSAGRRNCLSECRKRNCDQSQPAAAFPPGLITPLAVPLRILLTEFRMQRIADQTARAFVIRICNRIENEMIRYFSGSQRIYQNFQRILKPRLPVVSDRLVFPFRRQIRFHGEIDILRIVQDFETGCFFEFAQLDVSQLLPRHLLPFRRGEIK